MLILNDSEWEIMHVLWRAEQLTLGEIRASLAAEGIAWTSNTIQTLLVRLEKKGAVQIDKDASHHRYSALISREDCEATALEHLLRKAFRGAAEQRLASFVRQKHVTQDELDRLQDAVRHMPD